jgi:hypothetical protein
VGEFSWNTWLNHPPQSSRQEAVLDKFPWTFVPVQTAQKTIPTMLTPFQCGLANKIANKGRQKSSIINLYMELTKNIWYPCTKGNVLCSLTTYTIKSQSAKISNRFNYWSSASQRQQTLWPRLLNSDTNQFGQHTQIFRRNLLTPCSGHCTEINRQSQLNFYFSQNSMHVSADLAILGNKQYI